MRQAVVIFHGMGEQLPMQTVRSFVTSVWSEDETLIDRNRPDPNSGKARDHNASWSRPDPRTKTFEIRRITTEKADNNYYTDFFEFYWAHLVHGTTWEQVRSWIGGLLLRNPFRSVPRSVLLAWIVLWIVTLCILGAALWSAWPKGTEDAPANPLMSIGAGLGSLLAAGFISNVMVKRFGDVVRYVNADPPNIARRQEIREAGVAFLKSLILEKDRHGDPEYDRIIVVAHSLGTIVAYDILAETFAQLSRQYDKAPDDAARHPARAELEEAVRHQVGLPGIGAPPEPLTPDRYQQMQDAARQELLAFGMPWQVSDFVTLGSPLTHAEFLMADDAADLEALQGERALPTCPPVMEYDGTTQRMHFTFRRGTVAGIGKLLDGEKDDLAAKSALPRLPHHAALFAYTRWTNIYSEHRLILTGDIVSGPLARQFGLRNDDTRFSGIRDVAVMPRLDPATGRPDANHTRRGFSHNAYWSMTGGTDKVAERDPQAGADLPPHHIRELRAAIGLGRP